MKIIRVYIMCVVNHVKKNIQKSCIQIKKKIKKDTHS